MGPFCITFPTDLAHPVLGDTLFGSGKPRSGAADGVKPAALMARMRSTNERELS
jgi:hypothetical protein